MTEEEHLMAIADLGCGNEGFTASAFALVDEALREHPQSARLWCRRGDLILVCEDPLPENFPSLEDALASYLEAIRLDPVFAEGYMEVGYFHDVHNDDPREAEPYFRKAIELGAGVQAYTGLAGVLADLGRRSEGMELLEACEFRDSDKVQEMMEEIKSGMWDPET